MPDDDLQDEWCCLEIRPDEFYIVINMERVFGMPRDAAIAMAQQILAAYRAYDIQAN